MSTKSWLAVMSLGCMAAQWAFEFTGRSELVTTKWFLAFCIFGAAYFVVHHLDKRGG